MGDPNASIPTPQPVHYRPMFGAFGKARTATSLTFVSQAALAKGVKARLGLEKELVAVENVRGGHLEDIDGPQRRDARHRGRPGDLPRHRRRRASGLRTREGATDGAAVFPVLRGFDMLRATAVVRKAAVKPDRVADTVDPRP